MPDDREPSPLPPPRGRDRPPLPEDPPASVEAIAYTRLQQELIGVRTRLDRQVSQLIRLNRLSNTLLGGLQPHRFPAAIAEAIADVLDMACGLIWVMGGPCRGFASGGLPLPATAGLGEGGVPPWLLAALERGGGRAVRLVPQPGHPLLPSGLVDGLAAPCLDQEGRILGVLLAANTLATAAMADPVTDECLTVLNLLAEKVASHLEGEQARQLINAQLQQLRTSDERMQLVLRGTNDGWWDWDLQQGSCFLSSRWLEMLGHPPSEGTVQDSFWLEKVHPDDRDPFASTLEQALAGTATSLERELRLRCVDAGYLPVLMRGTIARDLRGRAVRFAGSILDLSERKRHEAFVEQLAFYDDLTKLPNRRLLMERLDQALEPAGPGGQPLALMLLDLDHFKRLNDSYGHAAGDQLLVCVAQRLVEAVRTTDTVARLGGDEFVVLLHALGDSPDHAHATAEGIAAHLLTTLAEPYRIEAGVTHHSASIGVALVVDEALSADQLMQRADLALYQAKARGRNTFSLYDPSLLRQAEQRTVLDGNLREALGSDALYMAYQGMVDAEGRLCGCEALMRWQPAEGPPIPPEAFIPVAEDSGLIHGLGHWGLGEVCHQLQRWQSELPPGFRVAVNVGAVQFQHPDFLRMVLAGLERTGVPGAWLRFEITEATVLPDLDFARDRMRALQAHGVEFALDDFGTGYSSLTYLRQLPVTEVKIDRSYTQRFLHHAHEAAIVEAILHLGRALGLAVVAEGVETVEQWQGLRERGCPLFQGYLFGRPAPPGPEPLGLLDDFAGRPVPRRGPADGDEHV